MLPDLTQAEMLAYDMLYQAAENHEPCPLNIDIEVALGFNSTSMGPKMIRKLEEKGLIVVQRFQKYRTVLIVATGRQTAPSPSMHVTRPHVPRGTRTAGQVTDRKLYRKGLV